MIRRSIRWSLAASASLVAGGSALLIAGAASPAAPAAAPAFTLAQVAVGGVPERVEAGDVDGDGDADLVVLSSPPAPASSQLTVLRNDGGAVFTPAWSATLTGLHLGAKPDLEIGDLDGDTDLDLLVNVPTGSSSSRLNAGDGTFDAVVPVGVAGERIDNELGDLNADGVLDYGYYEVEIIGYLGTREGNGDGSFPAFGPEIPGWAGDPKVRAALGEVTGDALTDLVLASSTGLKLARGVPAAGVPGWKFPVETLVAGAFGDVVLTDLDGDGITDAVASRPTVGTVAVLLGQAGGGFGPAVEFPAGPQADSIAVADLGNDGIPDVVVANVRRGLVSVLAGAGGGALLPPSSLFAARAPSDIAASDLDGDGDVDLAVTDRKGGAVVLLFNLLIP